METHKKIRLNWTNEMMDSENWDAVIFLMKRNRIWVDQMALNIICICQRAKKHFFKEISGMAQ